MHDIFFTIGNIKYCTIGNMHVLCTYLAGVERHAPPHEICLCVHRCYPRVLRRLGVFPYLMFQGYLCNVCSICNMRRFHVMPKNSFSTHLLDLAKFDVQSLLFVNLLNLYSYAYAVPVLCLCCVLCPYQKPSRPYTWLSRCIITRPTTTPTQTAQWPICRTIPIRTTAASLVRRPRCKS